MGIIFILLGIAGLLYGLMSVLGWTKNDISRDSDLDKKLLSAETRYFLRRYYSGFQFIIAGLGAIALGIIMWMAE